MTEHAAPDSREPLCTALDSLRGSSGHGPIAGTTEFSAGLALRADPETRLRGQYRSPAGRMLELEVVTEAPCNWIALHITLAAKDLTGAAWIGFACHSAGRDEVMVRPCLRSGTGDGFGDCFFPRHLLSDHEPRSHVDALYLPGARGVPETAPWRELVLFLPRETFVWHLHDLRLFLI